MYHDNDEGYGKIPNRSVSTRKFAYKALSHPSERQNKTANMILSFLLLHLAMLKMNANINPEHFQKQTFTCKQRYVF